MQSDDIVRELPALHQWISTAQPQPTGSIVDQLWGALGQGKSEELTELEDVYLELFSDEPDH